jgi:hypothetical protein
MGHAFWTRSTSRAEAAGIPATCAPTVTESTRTNGSSVAVLQHDNPNSQYMICHMDGLTRSFDRAVHGAVRIRSAVSRAEFADCEGAGPKRPPVAQAQGLDPGRVGGQT